MYFDTEYKVRPVATIFDAEAAISAIYHPSCQKCNKKHSQEMPERKLRHTRLTASIELKAAA
jgi:hypothetical protein